MGDLTAGEDGVAALWNENVMSLEGDSFFWLKRTLLPRFLKDRGYRATLLPPSQETVAIRYPYCHAF